MNPYTSKSYMMVIGSVLAVGAVGELRKRGGLNRSGPKVGDKVVFRASAVTALDPKARWRGVVEAVEGGGGGYVEVRWTGQKYPVGGRVSAGEAWQWTRWEDVSLLAKPGTVAANDRHNRSAAWWG